MASLFLLVLVSSLQPNSVVFLTQHQPQKQPVKHHSSVSEINAGEGLTWKPQILDISRTGRRQVQVRGKRLPVEPHVCVGQLLRQEIDAVGVRLLPLPDLQVVLHGRSRKGRFCCLLLLLLRLLLLLLWQMASIKSIRIRFFFYQPYRNLRIEDGARAGTERADIELGV